MVVSVVSGMQGVNNDAAAALVEGRLHLGYEMCFLGTRILTFMGASFQNSKTQQTRKIRIPDSLIFLTR
jgi:hypothetical protein